MIPPLSPRRSSLHFLFFLLLVGVASAQRLPAPPPAPPPPPAKTPPPPAPPVDVPPPPPYVASPTFGLPIDGLKSDELTAFKNGLANFKEVETPETGLGPIFNNVSCAACHSVPAVGGGSRITVTRFGRTINGQFDPLTNLGGSLLQSRSIAPILQEVIPADANVVAHRQTTPLFGAGLIEAIPDATIIANSLAAKPDGVKGTTSIVQDVASGQTRIGRFGWKAQQATLLSFAGDAYNNEMGITNRLFPTPNAPNGNTALLAHFVSLTAPPEDQPDTSGKADIDRLADYMRLLSPPPPAPATTVSIAGSRVFTNLGCAVCHVPIMTTGVSSITSLSQKPVNLYSDLLLHDMGTLGDGIAQGSAGTTEMRTAPLWGLHARNAYLHDGRATTVDAAIRAHAGEAKVSTTRYTQLSTADQQALLEFLNKL